MEYPLISEYKEAILSAEDNFGELTSLRPVLDEHGYPVMSSGNFAVVFKMKDEKDGKFYAVKCFTKDQEGRDESYKLIADELELISSSYIVPLRYLEKELFVDSPQCDSTEFPVVVMEWVEGETLENFLNRHLDDTYELEMLGYRFNRMAAWLLAQPFAHGDLKPDNILVRPDGSLVLVDYDGMFVPGMAGTKARELGSPSYRHPLRTDADFNEHIDDFSIAVISLSLKAIALNPKLKADCEVKDTLLLSDSDFRAPAESATLRNIQLLTSDSDLSTLLGIFYIALAKNSLDSLSFRLFNTTKPKAPAKPKPIEVLSTKCTEQDLAEGVEDAYGVVYSRDGKRLLKAKKGLGKYRIKNGTKVICDRAFMYCSSLHRVSIPDSVTSIGDGAFMNCKSLQSVTIPDSVTSIGNWTFSNCESLQSVTIPASVTSIGDSVFYWCNSLQSVSVPNSVTSIGNRAFRGCSSLQNVTIPSSVTSIGKSAFDYCKSLQSVIIPNSVTSIGDWAFSGCSSLRSVTIPDSVISIRRGAFSECFSLRSVKIPASSTSIGKDTFPYSCKVIRRKV